MSATILSRVIEEDFPASGSPRQKLQFAIRYAELAPTEGGWQPWYFRTADTHLELMAKNNPAREAVDPDGREPIIGCGSALLHLKLALRHFGCLGRVALFPNLSEPTLVARIHFGVCRERDPREKLLFEAMTGRRTNISTLGETPVSETMLAELSHAAAGERGWLDFIQSEASRQYVLKITVGGEQRLISFDHRRARPTRLAVEGHTPRWPRPLFAFGSRNLDSWNVPLERAPQPPAPATTLAVIKTKTDEKYGWLEAGQTMARTVLQAQALGLSWAFFDPVRRRDVREELRTGVGHKGFVQVILRFGPFTTDEPVSTTMPTARARAAIFR